MAKLKDLTLFTPLEFDKETFDREIEQHEELRKKNVDKYIQGLFNDFVKAKGDQGFLYFRDVDPLERVSRGQGLTERDRQFRSVTPLIFINDPDAESRAFEQRQILSRKNEWIDYLTKREQEAFGQKSPEFQRIDIEQGGIFQEPLQAEAFMAGVTDGLLLKIPNTDHPIYGKKVKEVFNNTYGWGDTLGSIISFMGLSHIVGGTSLMEKIYNAKSPVIQKALNALGKPREWMQKANKLLLSAETLDKIYGVAAMGLGDIAVPIGAAAKTLGAQSVVTGTIGALTNAIRDTALRLRAEDQKTKDQWLKGIPLSLAEGFFGKYFVGLINDPKSWPARFLGDAVYSIGQQAYAVASGKQESFDSQEFFRSFIQGHIMGEIQGAVFKPNREQIEIMRNQEGVMRIANKFRENGLADATDSDLFITSHGIWLGELENISRTGKPFTDAELTEVVKQTPITTRSGLEFYTQFKNPDTYKVTRDDLFKQIDEVRKSSYNYIKKTWALNNDELKTIMDNNILFDKNKYNDFYKKFNKSYLATPPPTKEVFIDKGYVEERVKEPTKPGEPAEVVRREITYNDKEELKNKIKDRIKPMAYDDFYSFFDNEIIKYLKPKSEHPMADIVSVIKNDENDVKIQKPDPTTETHQQLSLDIKAQSPADRTVMVDRINNFKDYITQLYSSEAALSKLVKRVTGINYRTGHGYGTNITDYDIAEGILKDLIVSTLERGDRLMASIENPEAYIVGSYKKSLINYIREQDKNAYYLTTADIDKTTSKKLRNEMVDAWRKGESPSFKRPISLNVTDEEGRSLEDTVWDKRQAPLDSIGNEIPLAPSIVFTIYKDWIEASTSEKMRESRVTKTLSVFLSNGYEMLPKQRRYALKQIGLDDLGERLGNSDAARSLNKRTKDEINTHIFKMGDEFGLKEEVARRSQTPEKPKKVIEIVDKPIQKDKDGKKIIIRRKVKRTKTVPRELTVEDRKMADDLIEKDRKQALSFFNRYNVMTGIPSDVRNDKFFVDKLTGDNDDDGVSIITITSYDEVSKKFGQDIANHAIYKAGNIIKNMIKDINSELYKSNGRRHNQRLYVKNPKTNGSKKFYFYSEGLTKDKLLSYTQYIRNVLMNNFNDSIDPGKQFAVLVDRGDDRPPFIISGFKNIDMGFSGRTQFDDIDRATTEFANAMKLASAINPKLGRRFEDTYYDSGNTQIKPIIEQLRGVVDLNTPRTFEEWASYLDDLSAKNPNILTEINTVLTNLASAKAIDYISNSVPVYKLIDAQQLDKVMPDTKAAQYDINIARHAEEPLAADSKTAQNMLDSPDSPISKIMIGAVSAVKDNKAAGFVRDLYDMVTDKITVWNNLDRNPDNIPFIQAIYKLGAAVDSGTLKGAEMMNLIFADFSYPKYTQDQMMAYNRVFDFMIESELVSILKADPNILNAPINWRNDNLDQSDMLRRWAERPESISDADIVLFRDSIKEKNTQMGLHKFLVQYAGFKSEDLKDIATRLENHWFKPVADHISHGYDKNINVFEILKNKYEKAIKDLLVKHANVTVDGRSVDPRALDFTSWDHNRLMALVDQIKNEKVRGHAESLVNFYISADPKNLHWIHHSVLGKHDNQVRFFSSINRHIEGKTPYGKEVADPLMKDFIGRKVPTLDDLVKAGYSISNNGLINLKSSMQYYFSKIINEEMARLFKSQFLLEFKSVYDNAIANNNPDIIKEFFRDNVGGYFYMPTDEEVRAVTRQIDDLSKRLRVMEETTRTSADEAELVKIGEHLNSLNMKKESMLSLIDTYSGDLPLFKGLKKDAKTTMANNFRRDIASGALGSDVWLPANMEAYKMDNTRGVDLMKQGIKLKHRGVYGTNLKDYDGLYFNRIAWKGMRQFVFRDDYLNKNYEYNAQKTFWKLYDKTNTTMKLIRFYKPTIIMMNDTVQALLANPAYVKNIGFGYKAIMDPTAKDINGELTPEARFFRLMLENNLYNKAVSFDPIMDEASKAAYSVLGKAGLLSELKDKLNVSNPLYKVANLGKFSFRLSQGITWGADGLIRTAVAKTMYDRFSQIHSPERAAWLASEWTNMFLVQYSRVPAATRQWMNRIGLVLTYRTQTIRMYKEMFRMAGQGILRMSGLDQSSRLLNNPFKVSSNRFQQGMFEIMPLARAIGMTGAIKILLGTMFGFGYDNIFDAITSYRAKRKKGKGLVDREFEFLSMGTPLFELEKIMSRPLKVTLKYNMAALPGFIYSWVANENLVTGKAVVTAKSPGRKIGQFVLDKISTYFPFGQDVPNFLDDDKNLIQKLINFSGLAYYYRYKTPQELVNDLNVALDQSKNMAERQAAWDKFYKAHKKAYKTLFNNEYEDIINYMDRQKQEKIDQYSK